MKKVMGLFVFFVVTVTAFAQTEIIPDIPLLTTQANNISRDDFYNLMKFVSEYPDNDILCVQLGASHFGPPAGQVSFTMFKNINDWLSVPIFGAGILAAEFGSSVFAGSGIIIKNDYLKLGLMVGFLKDDSTAKWFDYGVYPVLNTAEYPFLRFLEKIDGYLYTKERKDSEVIIGTLNYLLNFTFKPFLGLSVFELYIRKGNNDFRSDYDLSNVGVSVWEDDGNYYYHTGPVNPYNQIYNTNVYGLRVGGLFGVDLEYLTIDGLKEQDYYAAGNVIQYKEDSKYPFGLNGFPSITLNYFHDGERYFLRFNSLNVYSKLSPFIPDIGMIFKAKAGSISATWTFPMFFSFAFRFFGDWHTGEYLL